MRKIHILLISAVLLIPSLFGAWVAEPDFIQNLQLKLDLFYKVNRPAKIYMTFNQPKYAAGDTAFFTLHLRLGPDQAPVSGQQIINLRLVDLNQTLLLYNRIACDNGVVNGQLIFPGDLPPDIYTLIAYSDEMAQRQVLPSYFHRSIIISGEKEFLPVQNKDIQLFPEGGTLVAGLENKVVVSTTQKESVASVITESGGKITDFKISRGLGKFLITPQSGEQYFIEVDGERKKLPESGNDGIVMRVTTAENKESMQVIMQSKSISKWRTQPLYIVLNAQNKICFSTSFSFEKDSVISLSIPLKHCAPGVKQLTLFTANNDVLAGRLVYLQPDPVQVDINLTKTNYQTRQAVDLAISIKDLWGNIPPSKVTLSVYNEDLFENKNKVAIDGSSIDSGNHEAPDDYWITQTSEVFQWNEIFLMDKSSDSKRILTPSYFRGKVVFAGQKETDSTYVTFYLSKEDLVYGVNTRKGGEFEFPLFIDFGDDDVFYTIQYNNRSVKDGRIILRDYPGIDVPGVKYTTDTTKDAYGVFSKIRKTVAKSFSYHTEEPVKIKGEKETGKEDLVIDSDFIVNLKKYVPFINMREVIKEVVSLVRYRNVNGKDLISVFLDESVSFSRESPLYIIDGVMTDSTSYFLSLEPSRVSRIGVLKSPAKLQRFGSLGVNGIIIVETEIPDHAKAIPRTKRTLRIMGLSPPAKFSSQGYSPEADSRIPDLRSTIYWNPKCNINEKGMANIGFRTSDGIGTYTIRLEGLTEDGRFFVSEKNFTVSN